jgi:tetratricopeptide (TPR) repeat protein
MAAAPPHSSAARRLGINLALVICLGALSGVASLCLARSSRLRAAWPAEADTFYLPPSSALRIATLGHTELAADLIHARANVYFGTQLHARVPTKWLAKYLDTAIDLDPQFERLYLAGAAMVIYNGQKITPEMVLESIRLLERGRKAFPFKWELPFQMGFDYLFELPQDAGEDDPRVPTWRQRGVEMLRQAALYDGVPYYVPTLVARMLTKTGGDDLAIRYLEQAYAVTTNPEARQQIKLKLEGLRGQRAGEHLEEALRSFQQLVADRATGSPEAFAIVVGPRTTALGQLAEPAAPVHAPPQP